MTKRDKLYGKMLERSLIKESDGKIRRVVAKDIADIYSSDLDFESSEVIAVMHKDVSEIAKNILYTLKKECFI